MSSLNFISALRVGFENTVTFVDDNIGTVTVQLPLVFRGSTATEIAITLSFGIGDGTTADVDEGLS